MFIDIGVIGAIPLNPHFIDPVQTVVRIVIMMFGLWLGAALLIGKKNIGLGITQIVLTLLAPLAMGAHCYIAKLRGVYGGTDLELLASEFKSVIYGATMPLILVLIYIALIVVTTLSVKALIDYKRNKT